MVNRPTLYEILSYARKRRITSERLIAKGMKTSLEWVSKSLREYRKENTVHLVQRYTKDTTEKWCETYAETFKDWVVPINIDLMEAALKRIWTFGQNLK